MIFPPSPFATDADYRAAPGMNWSRIKHMRKSPKAYKYRLDTPEADTASRGMLRATHCLALEPHVFDRDFAIWTGSVRRGKVYDQWCEDNDGKTSLTVKEHAAAQAIAAAYHVDPVVRDMLDRDDCTVLYEYALRWVDPVFHVECKGKIDILILGNDGESAVVVDLKTVRRIDTRGFARDCADMGYHGQIAGHYARGVAAVFDIPEDKIGCAIVAVEGKDPPDVGVFVFSDDDIYAGRQLRDTLMQRIAECEAADEWPGMYDGPQTLDLPAWAVPGIDDDPDFTTGE